MKSNSFLLYLLVFLSPWFLLWGFFCIFAKQSRILGISSGTKSSLFLYLKKYATFLGSRASFYFCIFVISKAFNILKFCVLCRGFVGIFRAFLFFLISSSEIRNGLVVRKSPMLRLRAWSGVIKT